MKVCNSNTSADSKIRDFCDGSDFTNHDLFSNNPSTLILHCYYDVFKSQIHWAQKQRNILVSLTFM